MATFTSFEDIRAWQKARALTSQIYTVSKRARFAADRDLVRQMRRASVSVMSNIAEGFERHSRKEFHQFLGIARGSAGELRAQLYVAKDAGYIDEAMFEELHAEAHDIARMLSGLMKHLRRR
ncbi:MAG: four helix bundle protein [Bacteroidota bacterium]